MPVQLWDHVQDPLDVDKQKKKKELIKAADPYSTIPEDEKESQASGDDKRAKGSDDNPVTESQSIGETEEDCMVDELDQTKVSQGESLARLEYVQNQVQQNMYVTPIQYTNKLQQARQGDNNYDQGLLKDKLITEEMRKFHNRRHTVTTRPRGGTTYSHLSKSPKSEKKSLKKGASILTSKDNASKIYEIPQDTGEQQRHADAEYYAEIEKFKTSHDFLSLADLKAQFDAQQRNIMADIEDIANPTRPKPQPQPQPPKVAQVAPKQMIAPYQPYSSVAPYDGEPSSHSRSQSHPHSHSHTHSHSLPSQHPSSTQMIAGEAQISPDIAEQQVSNQYPQLSEEQIKNIISIFQNQNQAPATPAEQEVHNEQQEKLMQQEKELQAQLERIQSIKNQVQARQQSIVNVGEIQSPKLDPKAFDSQAQFYENVATVVQSESGFPNRGRRSPTELSLQNQQTCPTPPVINRLSVRSPKVPNNQQLEIVPQKTKVKEDTQESQLTITDVRSPVHKQSQTLMDSRDEPDPSDDNKYKANTLEEYKHMFKNESADANSQVMKWEYKANTLDEYKAVFSPQSHKKMKEEDNTNDDWYTKQGQVVQVECFPQAKRSPAKKKDLYQTQHVFQAFRDTNKSLVAGTEAIKSESRRRETAQIEKVNQDAVSNAANSISKASLLSGSKKIGGLARRRLSKDRSRQLADIKKTFSNRDENELSASFVKDNKILSIDKIQKEINQMDSNTKSYQQININKPIISKESDNMKEVDAQINRVDATYMNSNENLIQDQQPNKEIKNELNKTLSALENQLVQMGSNEPSKEIEQNPPKGMPIQTQTDQPTKLPHKIRRSRKSFSNQVYLEHSNANLKSHMSPLTITPGYMKESHNDVSTTNQQSVSVQKETPKKILQTDEARVRAADDVFEAKQRMIQANLEMISKLEMDLTQAKNIETLMQKNLEMEQQAKAQISKVMAVQTSSTTLPKAAEELSQEQSLVIQSRDKPRKGMVNAGVQLNSGKLENPRNKLNPMFLQNRESETESLEDFRTKFRNQGSDPKTRDQNTGAKTRDMALDPMYNEKSTDPKMQDIALDAWKRDGQMQTSIQQHEERSTNSALLKKHPEIIEQLKKDGGTQYSMVLQESPEPVRRPQNVNHGATQYSLKEAANIKDDAKKSDIQEHGADNVKQVQVQTYEHIAQTQTVNQVQTYPLYQNQQEKKAPSPPPLMEEPKKLQLDSLSHYDVLKQGNSSLLERKNSDPRVKSENNDPRVQSQTISDHEIDAKELEVKLNELKKMTKSQMDKMEKMKAQQSKRKTPPPEKSPTSILSKKLSAEGDLSLEERKNSLPATQNGDVKEDDQSVAGLEESASLGDNKDQVKNLPIYHDHLLEEVMNQKLNKQLMKSPEQRNESRSTQMMFENQFGKNRFSKRRETINDVIAKANTLNEQINVRVNNVQTIVPQNNLPPIKAVENVIDSSFGAEVRNQPFDDSHTTQQRQFSTIQTHHNMPNPDQRKSIQETMDKRNQFDNFRTPKVYPQGSTLNKMVSGIGQYQPPPLKQPPTEMRDPNNQLAAYALNQQHQQQALQPSHQFDHHHFHHQQTPEGTYTDHVHDRKCSKCIRRRARRAQAKQDSKSQQALAQMNDYGNPNMQQMQQPPPYMPNYDGNNMMQQQPPNGQPMDSNAQASFASGITPNFKNPSNLKSFTSRTHSLPPVNTNSTNMQNQPQLSSGLQYSSTVNQNFAGVGTNVAQNGNSYRTQHPGGPLPQQNLSNTSPNNFQQQPHHFGQKQLPFPGDSQNFNNYGQQYLGPNPMPAPTRNNQFLNTQKYQTDPMDQQRQNHQQNMSQSTGPNNHPGRISLQQQQLQEQQPPAGVNNGQGPSVSQSNQKLPMINIYGQSNYNPQAEINMESQKKPVMGFMNNDSRGDQQNPLKHFKGNELELYYMEKQLKPTVEKEIKHGFFEIRKKFSEGEDPRRDKAEKKYSSDHKKGTDEWVHKTSGHHQQTQQSPHHGPSPQTKEEEEVQVYVSHICLHNFHPIFCKFDMQTVKIILHYASIVYLNKGQTLYAPGFNDNFIYIILFGKCKLYNSETRQQWGQIINLGWTIGEEILFRTDPIEQEANGKKKSTKHLVRKEICKAYSDGCVLAIEKKNLMQIKKSLYERGNQDEFSKLEIVLRGNHLVKKGWK